MTSSRHDWASFVQASTVAIATGASLVLFAAIAAYWTWRWLGPQPEPRLPASSTAVVPASSAGGLFGNAVQLPVSMAATGSGIRLLGSAVAAAGHSGYALLRIDPRLAVAIREGEEIQPGLRLAAVARDHVILERGGVREILSWPQKSVAGESAVPRLRQ